MTAWILIVFDVKLQSILNGQNAIMDRVAEIEKQQTTLNDKRFSENWTSLRRRRTQQRREGGNFLTRDLRRSIDA